MRVISIIYAILIVLIDSTDIHVLVRGSSKLGQGLQVSQGEMGWTLGWTLWDCV